MYGMVNAGIHQFVDENLGPPAWPSICRAAEVEDPDFKSMDSYDDQITFNLVGAICDHTGLSQQEALEQFGTYWVHFASNSTFGNLLRLAGRTLIERLNGLDDMHDKVRLSMPHLKPPSFEVEENGDGRYQLHYYSDRQGLAPMVIGLLHGLAAESDETISVRQTAEKSDTCDHDIFEIRMLN